MRVPWGTGEWKRVVVYGLGASGLAASRLLRSQGVEIVGVDRRSRDELEVNSLEGDDGVELRMGSDPTEVPPGTDGVVLSPGVPTDSPLVNAARGAAIPVVAEVELGFLFVNGPVIGITGSNGKSTTTALTGDLLRAAGFEVEVCGNIGVPLSARVEGPAGRVFVTELSSFQLETIDTFRPRAAALLNFSADHLDRHGDGESYFEAKCRLFRNQQAEDVAVLNADDGRVATVEAKARRRFFSRFHAVEDGCFLDGDRVVEIDPAGHLQTLFHRRSLSLAGTHNLENAMAAALLSRAVGAAPVTFARTLQGFRGLAHRMQLVLERHGVSWFDDSKATNFAATLKSLEGCSDGTVHLILGGRNKGGDPAVLVDLVRRKALRVYLVGEAAGEIHAVLEGVVRCEMAGTMDTAVSLAAAAVRGGETVLLSPACASFDQYGGFAERGAHFQRLALEAGSG